MLTIFLCSWLPGCHESPIYACADNQARLLRDETGDSKHEGNQGYWNALSACSDKHKEAAVR